MRGIPLVSVVVPARNSARFISATLRSIEEQTLRDWECVFVDDGSTDQTVEIARTFAARDKRFRVLANPHKGKSMSRNEGFFRMHPQSPYVSFMDSDDVWQPGALESLVRRLEASPSAVGVHGLGDFIDAAGAPLCPGAFAQYGRRRRIFSGGCVHELEENEPTVFESQIWVGTVFPPGVLLTRRKNHVKAGLYDPQLRHCEDWDVSIRLSRQGPLEFLNEVVLGYRRHDLNQSNDWRGMRASVRRVHHKTFYSEANQPEQERMLRESWRAFQRFKIREKWNALFLQPSAVPKWRECLLAATATLVHAARFYRGAPPSHWGRHGTTRGGRLRSGTGREAETGDSSAGASARGWEQRVDVAAIEQPTQVE
jgi:glycosyltransferase involved in cell wall biosynthesis